VRVLHIIPDVSQPGLTEAERLALTVRNDASVSGACACGARSSPNRATRRALKGELVVFPMVHRPDCPAISPVLEELVDRLGPDLRFRPLVRETPEWAA
jgi:hypothetical protein